MSKIPKPLIEAVEDALKTGRKASGATDMASVRQSLPEQIVPKARTIGANKYVWDKKSGIGNTPNQQDIDYFGFERNMNRSEFRKYVPEGVWDADTRQYLIDEIGKGRTVAPPFLKAIWDKDKKAWIVDDHEGRSRADLYDEDHPDVDIPISIIPIGLRARDITDEMRNAPIIGQKGSPSYREYSGKAKK